jgi:hypothetical protein
MTAIPQRLACTESDSFSEQVTVRCCSRESQHKNLILNAIEQQPIRLDMAFSVPLQFPDVQALLLSGNAFPVARISSQIHDALFIF